MDSQLGVSGPSGLEAMGSGWVGGEMTGFHTFPILASRHLWRPGAGGKWQDGVNMTICSSLGVLVASRRDSDLPVFSRS